MTLAGASIPAGIDRCPIELDLAVRWANVPLATKASEEAAEYTTSG